MYICNKSNTKVVDKKMGCEGAFLPPVYVHLKKLFPFICWRLKYIIWTHRIEIRIKKTHFPLKKDSFIRYNWLIVFYFTSTWRTCLPYWDINLRIAASPKLHQQFIYWTSLQYYNSIQTSEIFHTNVTNVTNMACVKKTDIFIQKYRYEVWGSRFY